MSAVLITGGTGYTGQFLVQHFAASGYAVGYTHNSSAAQDHAGNVRAFKVNLATGEGLDESLQALTADGLQLVAVINCAAISQPAVCERDPAAAAAVNVPTHLLDALDRHQQRQLSSSASSSSSSSTQQPLLIHISSDQVYDGSRAWWREGDVCRPINTYGRTKLAAEQLIQQRWPHHAILRSSIIYGPQPRVPVGRTLFLQFVDQALASKTPTTFFTDEWRCPVLVHDVVRVCEALISKRDELQHRLFNMGGPQRLSRVDMAAAVAAARGHDPACILRAPASSVDRPVASPADISMDSSRLEEELGIKLTPFDSACLQGVLGQQGPECGGHS